MLRYARFAVLALLLAAAPAWAEPVDIRITLAPQDLTQLDFRDGSNRVFRLSTRTGKARGTGVFAGAAVQQYGWTDMLVNNVGDGRGYYVFTDADGDVAYVRWQTRTVFLPIPDETPMKRFDNGSWETFGGTGKFRRLKGAGSVQIRVDVDNAQQVLLEGEVYPAR